MFICLSLSLNLFILPSWFFSRTISSAEPAKWLEYNNIKPILANILAL